jgi:hypothetical protein
MNEPDMNYDNTSLEAEEEQPPAEPEQVTDGGAQ